MTLQKIEFEYDIPDGYRFVRLGKYNSGDSYINSNGNVVIADCDGISYWIIVEKIQEQEQPTQNPKRHKHADLIHALAEGAEIQWKLQNHLEDCDPSWYEDAKCRIKPKTKTVRFRNFLHTGGFVGCFDKDISDMDYFVKWQEVEIEE